jgi:hypothetical protein
LWSKSTVINKDDTHAYDFKVYFDSHHCIKTIVLTGVPANYNYNQNKSAGVLLQKNCKITAIDDVPSNELDVFTQTELNDYLELADRRITYELNPQTDEELAELDRKNAHHYRFWASESVYNLARYVEKEQSIYDAGHWHLPKEFLGEPYAKHLNTFQLASHTGYAFNNDLVKKCKKVIGHAAQGFFWDKKTSTKSWTSSAIDLAKRGTFGQQSANLAASPI